jgi:hypothetical protein
VLGGIVECVKPSSDGCERDGKVHEGGMCWVAVIGQYMAGAGRRAGKAYPPIVKYARDQKSVCGCVSKSQGQLSEVCTRLEYSKEDVNLRRAGQYDRTT